MEQMNRTRVARPPGKPSPRVISFDEMWAPYRVQGRLYAGAGRSEKRREVYIWTAVVEEGDGSRACREYQDTGIPGAE